MFHVMFIYDDEATNVDMLWIWCINFWKTSYSSLHDLKILLMHDNIMIDRLMSWMMMTKLASQLEGETLNRISTPIINCKKWTDDVDFCRIFPTNHLALIPCRIFSTNQLALIPCRNFPPIEQPGNAMY